jgi:hypothetical protein
VSSDEERENTDDLVNALKEQNKLLKSRLNQFEDETDSNDDDDSSEVAGARKRRRVGNAPQLTDKPTGQAGILKNLLHEWSTEQVDPPPSDALGVANAETEKMAAKHAALARPKKANAASASFANLLSGSDLSHKQLSQTERKEKILKLMTSMSMPEFLELAGADSFIMELASDKKKNEGAPTRNAVPIAGESFAKPNIQWKQGECLYIYDFASEHSNIINDCTEIFLHIQSTKTLKKLRTLVGGPPLESSRTTASDTCVPSDGSFSTTKKTIKNLR